METRYRGKEAFVDRLISLSIDNYGPLPQTLRTAAAKSNLATIARTAHTLKGSLGNLMATEPADLADRTQRAARAGDTVTTRLAVELAATVERLVAELTQQQKGRVQSED